MATPPRVSTLRPNVGPKLDAIVAKAVAPNPEERYATARELSDVLRTDGALIGAPLRAQLPCGECKTPLIITLPFCPGCGHGIDWAAQRGKYAVQLDRVRRPDPTIKWLRFRYGDALQTGPVLLRLTPLVSGVIGLAVAIVYVRRPILRFARKQLGDEDILGAEVQTLRKRFGTLKTARARQLALAAVARAAPVILGDLEGLPAGGPTSVIADLNKVVDAAERLDTHAEFLRQNPRGKLANDIASARSRHEAGTLSNGELERLEELKEDVLAASLAYDMAAREALDACQAISDVVSSRAQ